MMCVGLSIISYGSNADLICSAFNSGWEKFNDTGGAGCTELSVQNRSSTDSVRISKKDPTIGCWINQVDLKISGEITKLSWGL